MIPFHFIETAKAIHLDDDTIKIVLAIDADKKIVAIKELRIRTGCGLSEAKWLGRQEAYGRTRSLAGA